MRQSFIALLDSSVKEYQAIRFSLVVTFFLMTSVNLASYRIIIPEIDKGIKKYFDRQPRPSVGDNRSPLDIVAACWALHKMSSHW